MVRMAGCQICQQSGIQTMQTMQSRITPTGVFYDTRIVDFIADGRTYVGKPITVSGKLEFYCVPPHPKCILPPIPGWQPLVGEKIEIYVNDEKVVETTTAEDGKFVTNLTFNTPGTYTIKAHYPGSLLLYEDTWSLPVTVVVYKNKDEYDWENTKETMMWLGLAVIVGIVIFYAMTPTRELIWYPLARKVKL